MGASLSIDELETQQVLHADLRNVVNDEFVVQKGALSYE